MAYYDTTKEENSNQIALFTAKNSKQEVIILRVFQSGAKMTPFDVQRILKSKGHNIPITSVRRGITDLTTQGHLVKLDEKGPGEYGRKCFKWQIHTA
jgi:Fe2+ or Zn2+ uptake regulation protein